jgi:hypothetical protein
VRARDQSVTSPGERQLALTDGFGRVVECFLHVGELEVRVASNTSPAVMLSAIIPTTAATGSRRRRMHGTPSIWSARTAIRVKVMSRGYSLIVNLRAPDACFGESQVRGEKWFETRVRAAGACL